MGQSEVILLSVYASLQLFQAGARSVFRKEGKECRNHSSFGRELFLKEPKTLRNARFLSISTCFHFGLGKSRFRRF